MNRFALSVSFFLFAFGTFDQKSVGKLFFEKDKSEVIVSEANSINLQLGRLQFDTLFLIGRADLDVKTEYNYQYRVFLFIREVNSPI